ncbi:MAG: TPP-dependent pyruvate/acetoin dehydrogenase alpha subunit, partial [Saprospiraceae bacterium]
MIDNPVFTRSIEQSGGEDNEYIREVLKDFWTCCVSREASLLGRKEVLTGKAKFGILGDGKEVPQVAMARAFKKGDWRSGYYRDQTLMFALGLASVEDFFAQLYADCTNDPFSGGRQMNSHFATENVNKDGAWAEHKSLYNISSDISSTGGQMARALGLALASKKYRESELLRNSTQFSENGNEVCFCTIGDASTSEGVFWETVNAAGVLRVPLAISIWDDGYGISVPKKYQTTKGDISEVLEGFRLDDEGQGIDLYRLKGWDYPTLCEAYEKGIEKMRKTHIPAVFHVDELTQPQGHSTSGSHERYKGKERLEWEKEMDCLKVMRKWIIDTGIASEKVVDEIAIEAREFVKNAKNRAWNNYIDPIRKMLDSLKSIYTRILEQIAQDSEVDRVYNELNKAVNPLFAEILQNARRMLFFAAHEHVDAVKELKAWISKAKTKGHNRYHTHLYSNSKYAALKVPVIPAEYSPTSKAINGYQILNNFFDQLLERTPNLFA